MQHLWSSPSVFTTRVQAGGGMDENIIQELRNLIEQQQKQLDRQGAEIAKLQEQLGGAAQQVELEELDTEEKRKLVFLLLRQI